MSTTVTGNFTAAVPAGMPEDLKPGDILPEDIYNVVYHENEARVRLNLSDPSRVRPFIDMSTFDGPLPDNKEQLDILISQLIHTYRQANPNVIHAAAIRILKAHEDSVSLLTDLYYQCQSAFERMLSDIRSELDIPDTPSYKDLSWEHVAFPRLVSNLDQYKLVLIFIEQDANRALVVNTLLVPLVGEALVYSTRYTL